MMKRLILFLCSLCALCLSASAYDGGIKAKVVARQGRAPIAGAVVSLYSGQDLLSSQKTGAEGDFLFPDLMKAHANLDAAVEAAYGVDFDGDEEKIVAHLFKLYAQKTKAMGE